MDRRSFIRALSSLGLLTSAPAFAFGRSSQLTFAVLDTGQANPRINGWKRLGLELERRTSISVVPEPVVVDVSSPELYEYPLILCLGAGSAPAWTSHRWARLAHYLRRGGMVYFDTWIEGDDFPKRCMERLQPHLPADAMQKTDAEHVLYRSFYLLEAPTGRLAPRQQAEIAVLDGRMVALATQVDLSGALMRDEFGAWAYSCQPGGEGQREDAIRFGVNMLMYALCTDYKADQVHIPFLLKRRR